MKIYHVGGAVRDELMGLVPKDRDYLVTGATPELMLSLGYQQVGADFPVFLHPKTGAEYALARRERKNGVGYHGFDVEFGDDVTVKEDLLRRDLTINAMARDVEDDGTWGDAGFHDPFGGREDIKNKILRHVSPAFAEDPLRVIRLARFYARYKDFSIAPETADLAREVVNSFELNTLPFERFWAELRKVFSEATPDRFFVVGQSFRMFDRVKFFVHVYGNFDIAESSRIIYHSRDKEGMDPLSADDKLMIHTALMVESANAPMPDSRTKDVASGLEVLRNYSRSMRAGFTSLKGDTMVTLLSVLGAYRQGTAFIDLLATLRIGENAHHRLHEYLFANAQMLWHAQRVSMDINAAVAEAETGVKPGKEMGAAIARLRAEAIKRELNLSE